MEPENQPLEKKISVGNHHFFCSILLWVCVYKYIYIDLFRCKLLNSGEKSCKTHSFELKCLRFWGPVELSKSKTLISNNTPAEKKHIAPQKNDDWKNYIIYFGDGPFLRGLC